jgi:hypothetical protein
MMDRNLVYPGSIPLDTDLLALNRNTMVALGALAQAVLGTATLADGLACAPTAPASLGVTVGPGAITQLSVVDSLAFGSLAAETDPLLKMGINLAPTSFSFAAPATSGQSINYLIQAALQETDAAPVVLPYYNAANPALPFAGPANSGVAQNTQRIQRVQLQMKAGSPAITGTQATPPVDNGWVGLHVVSVAFGQAVVAAGNIATHPAAPFLAFKLAQLRPGFASGVQSIAASGGFIVPAGVTQVEVEVWGGGAGSYASLSGTPSGGAAGGGYGRKRIAGLTPGQAIAVSIGAGGSAGATGVAPTPGGTSSFGSFVSASGGGLNGLATVAVPYHGGTPGGIGSGGDLNLAGSEGNVGITINGGMGGGAPNGGGMRNAGAGGGNPGLFPGGGASGAGTGSNGTTANPGAAGAAGLVIVRW